MDHVARAAAYRERAEQVERKAQTARTDNMRRAWLILARDWRLMAERVELKRPEPPVRRINGAARYNAEPPQSRHAPSLIPDQIRKRPVPADRGAMENAIRELARSLQQR